MGVDRNTVDLNTGDFAVWKHDGVFQAACEQMVHEEKAQTVLFLYELFTIIKLSVFLGDTWSMLLLFLILLDKTIIRVGKRKTFFYH